MRATSLGARPSLLFLCHTLPYPPDSGVKIRTYNILRLLAREFAVSVLCFQRGGERRSAASGVQSLQDLLGLARAEAFPIAQEHSWVRLFTDHAQSLARRRAYTIWTYASRQYRSCIDRLLAAGEVDLVHMDSLDLAGYLPMLCGVPVVCTHHNVESQLLRRRAFREDSRWLQMYMRWQAAWVEDLERYWAKRVALNVVVSDADRGELARLAPGANIGVVPNGVDIDNFRPVSGPTEGIVFAGGFDWFPNRDALEYFSSEILPRIRATGNAAPVRWVGRSSDTERRYYGARHGIDLTGYVDDIRPYVTSAACYVVPLRVGGGTRLKILEAWAMGKAVVSTSAGCEGLEAVDGENILVRDDPSAFAQAVCDVLADTELRSRLGRAARVTVERRYSWEVIAAELNRLYRPLVRSSRG